MFAVLRRTAAMTLLIPFLLVAAGITSAEVAAGGAVWQWQNPKPVGTRLLRTQFVTSVTG